MWLTVLSKTRLPLFYLSKKLILLINYTNANLPGLNLHKFFIKQEKNSGAKRINRQAK